MANGKMVQMLIHTDVVKYLEFKSVDGSFVVKAKAVHKVPSNDMEALRSPLMGIFEKRRARSFFIFVQDYNVEDQRTWQGFDLKRIRMRDVFAHFGLDEGTTDFIGHCLALQQTEDYLDKAAFPTVMAIKMYSESMLRFGGGSPYIYPLYGLGELPQAFARLSAVYGGTYMLNKPDATVVFDAAGKACGVSAGGETVRAPLVVGDPSYFPGKCTLVGRAIRAICLLNHPIPNTGDAASAQIIIPNKQLGRKGDVYIFSCNFTHSVVGKGKWVAFVSTSIETSNPVAELAPGLALLGPIEYQFTQESDIFWPNADGSADGCFISRGYDETSHFEGLTADVLSLYKRITGTPLVLSDGPAAAAHGTA